MTEILDDVTMVLISLTTPGCSRTFGAGLRGSCVRDVLRAMDKRARRSGGTVNQAKSYLIDQIEDCAHHDAELATFMAGLLLWVACRDHTPAQNRAVEKTAATGGSTLAWRVVADEADVMTWALVAGPTADHPLLAATLEDAELVLPATLH